MIIYTHSCAQGWGRNVKHKALKKSYCHDRNAPYSEVDIEVQFLRNGKRNNDFDDCSLFMIAKSLIGFYYPKITIKTFTRILDGSKNNNKQPYNMIIKMLPQKK